jgi:hypothetical protein
VQVLGDWVWCGLHLGNPQGQAASNQLILGIVSLHRAYPVSARSRALILRTQHARTRARARTVVRALLTPASELTISRVLPGDGCPSHASRLNAWR